MQLRQLLDGIDVVIGVAIRREGEFPGKQSFELFALLLRDAAQAELSAARYLPLKALQGLFAAALSAAAGLFLPDEFFCAAAGRLSGGIFPAAWLSVPLCAGGCLLHQKFWAGKTGVGRL